jgi:hypothetical protein
MKSKLSVVSSKVVIHLATVVFDVAEKPKESSTTKACFLLLTVVLLQQFRGDNDQF